MDYASVFPAGARAMVGLQRAVDAADLEPLLLELVKMRASQINGCAYCLDMHAKDQRLESAGDLHAGAGRRIRLTASPDIEPFRRQPAGWARRNKDAKQEGEPCP